MIETNNWSRSLVTFDRNWCLPQTFTNPREYTVQFRLWYDSQLGSVHEVRSTQYILSPISSCVRFWVLKILSTSQQKTHVKLIQVEKHAGTITMNVGSKYQIFELFRSSSMPTSYWPSVKQITTKRHFSTSLCHRHLLRTSLQINFSNPQPNRTMNSEKWKRVRMLSLSTWYSLDQRNQKSNSIGSVEAYSQSGSGSPISTGSDMSTEYPSTSIRRTFRNWGRKIKSKMLNWLPKFRNCAPILPSYWLTDRSASSSSGQRPWLMTIVNLNQYDIRYFVDTRLQPSVPEDKRRSGRGKICNTGLGNIPPIWTTWRCNKFFVSA